MRTFIQKTIAASFFAFIASAGSIYAQAGIERKIIVDKGNAYYCTVDDDWQLATLHATTIGKSSSERVFELPLGRERKDEFMPLCFDMKGNKMIGLNWITNATNSRNEALKKIRIDELASVQKNATEASVSAWLERSFAWPYLTSNEPWMAMLRRDNVLDNCYFDLTMLDNGHVVMAVCNHNDLMLWEYDGKQWQHSQLLSVTITGYFSLASLGTKTWLIMQDGSIFRLDGEDIAATTLVKENEHLEQPLKDIVLIVDHDNRKILYTSAMQEATIVLQQLRNGHAQPLLSIE